LSQFWNSFKPWLLLVVTVISFSQAIKVDATDLSIVVSTITPYASERPILFILSAIALYFCVFSFRYRNVPLSLVDAQVKIYIDSPDGSKVRIARKLKIRAYRSDVTGYFRDLTALDGRIDRDSISSTVDFLLQNQQEFKVEGTDKRLVVTTRFNKPIPRPWYKLGLNTVCLRDEVLFLDAFTAEQESYTIETIRYPVKKLSLSVLFSPDNPPNIPLCDAYRVKANGVTNEKLITLLADENKRHGIKVQVKRSSGEKVKIVWVLPH